MDPDTQTPVAQVAAIGFPDPKKPGTELVKAYVTLDEDAGFQGSEADLKASTTAFAKEKLAAYEIPRDIEIRKELPLTSVGKLDKKKLRKGTSLP